MTNISYEKEVYAEVIKNPNFEIPEATRQEVIFTSFNTIRATVYETGKIMIQEGGFVTKAVKFSLTATAEIPFTAIDIVMSYKTEGIVQAVVTATMATGVSICFGFVATTLGGPAVATMGGAVLIGISAGFVNYCAGKLLDGMYDFGEQIIQNLKYNEQTNNISFDTPLSNLNDIKTLVGPMYEMKDVAIEEYLGEIEIRQVLQDITTTYTIKSGDTISAICTKYGISLEALLELNPWLSERFSSDGKFALIKPGEKLVMPNGLIINNNETAYTDLFRQAQSIPAVIHDPLIVDLDSDGIETTTLENGVYFDNESDGFAEMYV